MRINDDIDSGTVQNAVVRGTDTAYTAVSQGEDAVDRRTDTSYPTSRPHLTEQGGQLQPLLESSIDNIAAWSQRLCAALGVPDIALAAHVLDQAVSACSTNSGEKGLKADAVLGSLCDSADNTLALMLKIQMLAAHHHAMELMRKAAKSDSDLLVQDNLKLTAKLMNAYAGHMALLDKITKGCSQTMTVRHVHVHDGGQAIVGCVSTGRG